MNIEFFMLFVWLAAAYWIISNFRPPFGFAYAFAGFGDVDVDEHERPAWLDIAMFKRAVVLRLRLIHGSVKPH